MRRVGLSLLAAGLLAIIAVAPATAQDTVTIDMKEVEGSGQSGSADITSDGEQTIVTIEIEPGEEGVAQPAHIHDGTCNDLGDVAFPLDDVVDGASESTVDISVSDLIAGEYAVNVHLSEDEIDVYVSCGTLPQFGGGEDEGEGDADQEEADDEDSADDEEADDEEAADDEASEGEDEEAIVPATGSTGGMSTESGVVLLTLAAGALLGFGVLVRRRANLT